jgi:hypothetical protein
MNEHLGLDHHRSKWNDYQDILYRLVNLKIHEYCSPDSCSCETMANSRADSRFVKVWIDRRVILPDTPTEVSLGTNIEEATVKKVTYMLRCK